jgi:uncharacterized protein YggT (Ycf19 family)
MSLRALYQLRARHSISGIANVVIGIRFLSRIFANSGETVAPSSMVMKTTDLLVRIFDILTMSFGLRTFGSTVVVVVLVVVVDSIVVDVGRESDGMGSSALALFDNPICIASTEVKAIQAMFKDFFTK